jgi:hypothetical protein
VDKALQEYCSRVWQSKLYRTEAQTGQGRNKLRTYRLFKNTISAEPYLMKVMSKSDRSSLAKMRCGVAPLQIETGRYQGVPENERTCDICSLDVESEEHFLLVCPLYDDLREELFIYVSTIQPNFVNLSNRDKLSFLLSNESICAKTAKTLNMMFR